jgi:hypothetical protein
MKIQTMLLQIPYRLDYLIQRKNAVKLYAQRVKEQQNENQIQTRPYGDRHSSGHGRKYRRNTTSASN